MKLGVSIVAVLLLVAVSQAAVAPIGGFLNVQLAKYDPIPAEAGKTVTVWIKAENLGTEPVKGTKFELKVGYPFSLPNNDAIREYGSIGAGDDVLLEYKLNIVESASNGTHKIKFITTFGAASSEDEFEITVEEGEKDADLDALFVSVSPKVVPGGTARLTMDVVNRNPGTAFFTIVKVDSDAAIIERNEIYVGNLESDDFDGVDFDLKIPEDVAPGTYPVDVTMTYKNKDSVAFEKTDTINIEVSAKGAEGSETQIPIETIVISIIGLLIAIRLAVPFFNWFVKPFRKHKK